MTKIVVNQYTAPSALEKFANEVGDNAKIRAKDLGGGAIELYVSKKTDTGFKEKLFGQNTQRQNLARTTLSKILDNPKTYQLAGKAYDTAITNVQAQVLGKGELRGAVLKQAVADAKTGIYKDGPLGWQAMKGLQNNETQQLDRLVQELGDNLAQKLKATSPDQQLHAIATQGDGMKGQMLKGLARQVTGDAGLLKGDYATAAPETKAFLDKVYNRAVMQLGCNATNPRQAIVDESTGKSYEVQQTGGKPFIDYQGLKIELSESSKGEIAKAGYDVTTGKQLSTGGVTLKPITVYDVEINGEKYRFDKHLATGGFGTADIYKSSTGRQTVIKVPIMNLHDTPEMKFAEASKEVEAHYHATQGGGHANVLNMEGGVRASDGKLLIALEFAEHGTLYSFARKIDQAVQDGKITQTDAKNMRLALMRDVCRGLQHLQETKGIIHLDLKSLNIFIDANGVARIADFGTAQKTANIKLRGSPVDNPLWLAPEVILGKQKYKARYDQAKDHEKAIAKKGIEQFFPKKAVNALLKKLGDQMTVRAQARVLPFEATPKADTWSAGVVIYEILFGKMPFEQKGSFASDVEDDIAKWAQVPNNRIIQPSDRPNGQLSAIDHWLNDMMHQDKDQRPTMTQALANPIFNDAAIDDQNIGNVRNLIKQVAS